MSHEDRSGGRQPRSIDASLAAATETVDEAWRRVESANTQLLRADTVIRRVRAQVEMSEQLVNDSASSAGEDDPDRHCQRCASNALMILLIDGHDDTRALYGHSLTDAGCSVEEAGDGEDGLAKALGRPYDVIVTEVSLRSIDGYALCGRLRADRATERTPVIVVTAEALEAARDRARAAGADAVLVKPCLPEDLLAMIERLVGADRFRASRI